MAYKSIYQEWREEIKKQIANTDNPEFIKAWRSINSALIQGNIQLAVKRVKTAPKEVINAWKEWLTSESDMDFWGRLRKEQPYKHLN